MDATDLNTASPFSFFFELQILRPDLYVQQTGQLRDRFSFFAIMQNFCFFDPRIDVRLSEPPCATIEETRKMTFEEYRGIIDAISAPG